MVDDCLDPGKKAVALRALVTDGTWLWPADLRYYVAAHHVALPKDFVAHMRARQWRPPHVECSTLSRLAGELQGN